MFPDQLWLPTQRDVVSDFAPRSVMDRVNTGDTATDVRSLSPSPAADKVWIVTHVFGRSNAGGAQTTSTIRLGIREAVVDTLLCVLEEEEPAGSVDRAFIRSQTPFVLMEGQLLELACTFNLGVSSNFADLSYWAAEIPRGNWQR